MSGFAPFGGGVGTPGLDFPIADLARFEGFALVGDVVLFGGIDLSRVPEIAFVVGEGIGSCGDEDSVGGLGCGSGVGGEGPA